MPYVFLDAEDTAVNKLDVAPVLMLFIYSSVLSRVETDRVVCRVPAVYRYQMEELGTGICWFRSLVLQQTQLLHRVFGPSSLSAVTKAARC